MKLKFGPSGLGSVKEAVKNLEAFHKLGLKACEIAFTYGVYIHDEKDAKIIGEKAKELGIELSIHAPYYVNLNSDEKEKIEASKQRILDCCRVGEILGAKVVVFHAGFFGKTREKAYGNIREQIIEMQKEISKNSWKIKLAPETMGKINVFGSVEEISQLVKETGCSFCIDFAHILARDKIVDFEKLKKLFPEEKWHCHFSGIEYGEKGEKKHIPASEKLWKELLENLQNIVKEKEIKIICEAPDPVGDAVMGMKVLEK